MRDQTRLPCEFRTNQFSGSQDMSYTIKCSAVTEMVDRLATIDMGRKVAGAVLLFKGEELAPPSNTMSPGSRPTSVPSGILIHPAVWPPDMGRKLGALPLFRGCVAK